ncbi:TonB-dependent siderophore receptor [Shewanella maritima]|uniref:TonB-dependent siderophore receptor n=1 Tax=Shewanella maritima TaxID=2520507 RepID=A0A411PJX9_9GAMM|nr:TonB-dependent siderophore receptor [Shewanella maritima]
MGHVRHSWFCGDENSPSGYLINGFNAGRGYSGNRDMSNVEMIEVLKGPSSALYGRGEPGGTINITTKKPQFEEAGSFKLTGGSFNTYRAEGDYTNAITDNLAFRINGAHEDAESYRDHVYNKKTVLTPSFLYELSRDTKVSYELELVDQEAVMDRGIVAVEGKEFNRNRFYGEPGDGPVKIKALGHQVQVQHDFENDWALTAGASYRTSQFQGTATEATGYIAETNQVSRQRRYRDFNTEDLSLRFEFSGSVETLGLTHNLLVGGDAYEYELDRVVLRYRDNANKGDYAIDFDKPVYRDPKDLPAMGDNINDVELQKGQGVYFQDQIDLSDKWKAMFGMRYDNFSQEITNRLGDTNTVKSSYSFFNPRFGLVYELSNDARVYASYSEGARPNAGVDTKGNAHDPEQSHSYELGIKWDSQALGLRGTAAIFDTKKFNILASAPSGDGSTEAIGEATSKGFELDLAYDLTEDTLVSLAYAYIDAQNAKDIKLWGAPIKKGAGLANVPKHSGSLIVRHFAEIGNYEGNAGFIAKYVGEQVGDFTDQDFKLPSYQLLNLFANVSLNDSLELSFNIENLFNEEYYINSYQRAWTMPGAPRTFKASVKYTF